MAELDFSFNGGFLPLPFWVFWTACAPKSSFIAYSRNAGKGKVFFFPLTPVFGNENKKKSL